MSVTKMGRSQDEEETKENPIKKKKSVILTIWALVTFYDNRVLVMANIGPDDDDDDDDDDDLEDDNNDEDDDDDDDDDCFPL